MVLYEGGFAVEVRKGSLRSHGFFRPLPDSVQEEARMMHNTSKEVHKDLLSD